MRHRAALPAAVALAALAGCEYFDKTSNPTPSPSPGTAALALTVAPDPLRVLWVCPPADTNCYGSLDATVTITETAGVGGRVDSVDFVVKDAILGLTLTSLHLSGADIKDKGGTDRIDPLGKLSVRPIVEGYPWPASRPRPQIAIDVTVQLTDDNGHAVTATKRVPVT